MAMTASVQESSPDGEARFLDPGTTCWRVEPADRAALLVDGADYFAALRSAMLKARRSIFIIGWDIDSRAPLRAGRDDDDPAAPERLGELLDYIAARRPEIEARLLLWNYSILYSVERELLPSLSLGWQTPPQVAFCFDDKLPLGASHHQKLVVIDDAVAFCGGIDVTGRRWDRSAHDPADRDRVDPAGKPYAPFHDMQMVVDGAAARALGELARERWSRATGQDGPAAGAAADMSGAADLWPTGVTPDFERVGVGIARTLPAFDGREAVREVEALYLRSIELAQRHIYIENQYLTPDRIADALCKRLRDVPGLEVVIVGPDQPHGWLEAKSMGAGRVRFRRCLEKAGVLDRVRIVYPFVGAGARRTPVMVHAKAIIVDDDLLRVGSANLNNRSMGLDSECDLAIEAGSDGERRAIAGLRDRLLAEHLGADPEDVAAAMREYGSILAVVDGLGRADRGLSAIQDLDEYDDEIGRTIRPFADPERPIEPDALMGGMSGMATRHRPFRRLAALATGFGLLVGLTLLWQFTPLADLLTPDRLAPHLDALAGSAWAPFAVLAAFVIGGFVVFPVTVLIALTAMTFGPWQGFAYAAAGALLSAAVTYRAGSLVRRRWLLGLIGPRIERVSRRLGKQGVVSVVLLRAVPVAPFTFVNLIAGASQIRFRDYMIGTVLGMAPGIVLMTALGDRLRQVWQNPTWTQIGLLAAVIAVWVGLSLVLQRAVARRRR